MSLREPSLKQAGWSGRLARLPSWAPSPTACRGQGASVPAEAPGPAPPAAAAFLPAAQPAFSTFLPTANCQECSGCLPAKSGPAVPSGPGPPAGRGSQRDTLDLNLPLGHRGVGD